MKEEEHKDEIDEFTGTAVRLMRLTREGKISWRMEASKPGRFSKYAPTMEAEINGLHFRLEDVGRRADNPIEMHFPAEESPARLKSSYRLVVIDEEANEEIVSPPMQAARDLAALVKSRASKINLSDINRRLDEALEP